MPEDELMAEQFERHRVRLSAVAYRMLGSHSEAEDAVQEAWLRLNRAGAETISNPAGWLTTVVARVALDMLRARSARREHYAGSWLPEPVVTPPRGPADPEHEAILADSVGIALLVVLDTLSPKERLAFVLHDMFGVPFEEIAQLVDRTPDAARQLASRARRRVRGAPISDVDLARQRELVDAFMAAARDGDFGALMGVLDPDVVFNRDGGGVAALAQEPVAGAEAVARVALAGAHAFLDLAHPAIVNGGAGLVIIAGDRTIGVVGFTITGDRIAEIDLVTDPAKLGRVGWTER